MFLALMTYIGAGFADGVEVLPRDGKDITFVCAVRRHFQAVAGESSRRRSGIFSWYSQCVSSKGFWRRSFATS